MTQSAADSSLLSLFDLADKIAVVTGAGAGIGKAIAQVLAKAGARVVVADIKADAAQAVAEGVNAGRSGASAVALAAQVDIADEKSVIRLFDLTGNTFGGTDVLVNNAGIYEHTPFLDTPVEKFQRVLEVNTIGTYLCMREAIKRMKSAVKGGAIVNISSAASLAPVIFDNNDYGASKAGVNNLTHTAALESAPDQIHVNAVLPGGVATGRALSSVSHKPPRGPMAQPGRFPLGRMATPEDIDMAVLFLASPAAGYITGQRLAVDGGFQVSQAIHLGASKMSVAPTARLDMRKWQCFFCGYIYDEAAGDADGAIAPGTRWEDIPDTWVCPGCGAAKSDFAMMEVGA